MNKLVFLLAAITFAELTLTGLEHLRYLRVNKLTDMAEYAYSLGCYDNAEHTCDKFKKSDLSYKCYKGVSRTCAIDAQVFKAKVINGSLKQD